MRRDWRPLTLVTQVGLTMVVTLVLCLLLGLWLDSLLHTSPLLTLVFSLIGIVAGTIGVYRMVSEAIAESVADRGPDYHPRSADGQSPPPAEHADLEPGGNAPERGDWDAAGDAKWDAEGDLDLGAGPEQNEEGSSERETSEPGEAEDDFEEQRRGPDGKEDR